MKRGDHMPDILKSAIPKIESVYESLTPAEKEIADFFINNTDEKLDFSAKYIANLIHVSEASLTRFAKKCGFSGYREFSYDYQSYQVSKDTTTQSKQTKRVLLDYQQILNKGYSLVDSEQIKAFVAHLTQAKRVYVYGKGSSGLAAIEMKNRFMRMGLPIEAISDDDVMKVNHVLVNPETLVIGFSVSGKKSAVLEALQHAHAKGANTVLFTTQQNIAADYITEVIPIPSAKNLDYGNRISPQLPLLIITDIIYNYFMEIDNSTKDAIFKESLATLDKIDE